MTEPLVNMKAAQLLQHFASYARLNDAMMGHHIELFERLRAVLGPSAVINACIARGDWSARRRALQRGG